MRKILVLKDAYERLDRICATRRLDTKSTLTAILVRYSALVTEVHAPILQEFDAKPIQFWCRTAVDDAALGIALKAADTFQCRVGSFVSMVMKEILPTIENNLDAIPGVDEFSRTQGMVQVALDSKAHAAIKASIRRGEEEAIGDPVSINDAVAAILTSHSMEEFLEGKSVEEFGSSVAAIKIGRYIPVSLPVECARMLSDLSAMAKVSKSKLLTYLVMQDLSAGLPVFPAEETLDVTKEWEILSAR